MCFDGSLGNVQIASDFRVVAPLQQQIDDLALAGPHVAVVLFHHSLHLTDEFRSPSSGCQPGPGTHLDSGLCVFGEHARGQNRAYNVN
jgi:hypothetical protein